MLEQKPTKLSRPVVASLRSAIEKVKEWMKHNDYHHLRDKDGLVWQVDIKFNLRSREAEKIKWDADLEKNSNDLLRPIELGEAKNWVLQLDVHTMVDAEELLRSQVLHTSEDQRLLSFLQQNRLPLQLRRFEYFVADEQDARKILVEFLPILRQQLEVTDMQVVKRKLVVEWVDRICRFGAQTAADGKEI